MREEIDSLQLWESRSIGYICRYTHYARMSE